MDCDQRFEIAINTIAIRRMQREMRKNLPEVEAVDTKNEDASSEYIRNLLREVVRRQRDYSLSTGKLKWVQRAMNNK
jgi:hypothetical protein